MDPCMIAKVAVDNAAFSFDRLFSYRIPSSMQGSVRPGMRVMVPFGRGDRLRTGMVFVVEPNESEEPLKELQSKLDDTSILTEELLGLCEYLVRQTLCTYFEAVRLMIPRGLMFHQKVYYRPGRDCESKNLSVLQREILACTGAKSEGIAQQQLFRKFGIDEHSPEFAELLQNEQIVKTGAYLRGVGDETIKMVRLGAAYAESNPAQFTPKQQMVFDLFESGEFSVSLKEACYYTGVTQAVVDNLVKKGALEYYEQQVFRNPYAGVHQTEKLSEIKLSTEQNGALSQLLSLCRSGKPQAALLYGVTGSGKTAVFLKAVEQTIAGGKNVIVMVPEISLTAQTITRFHDYFGEQVAILHSGLSVGERLDEWRRIHDGMVRIVIGTRSAVFAPFENLGLVVIDEEQEHSYKSEQSPRYHAREVAKYRCVKNNALLLLASATPDIETYYHAQTGDYTLVTLKNRYNRQALPETAIINMCEQKYAGDLSDTLLQEIDRTLQRGEQTILLNNRRGFHTSLTCKECGTIETCPNCSIALTYHRANERLMCHYCGYSKPLPRQCVACGSELMKYAGAGTQNIEQQLCAIFPQARVLRMDQDTTMAKFAHDKYFRAFSQGEYDILVGTQMVAKGLDFPNVTLVGVLGADRAIYSGDFKGAERAFSLITQVVGRCGRGEKAGRAIIQTRDDQSDVILFGCRQDYEGFYEQEIRNRRMMIYPPFCDICTVGFSSEDASCAEMVAKSFLEQIKQMVYNKYRDVPLKVLGPSKTAVFRVGGRYRYKMIIKCKNNARFRQMMREMKQSFSNKKDRVTLVVDFSSEIHF